MSYPENLIELSEWCAILPGCGEPDFKPIEDVEAQLFRERFDYFYDDECRRQSDRARAILHEAELNGESLATAFFRAYEAREAEIEAADKPYKAYKDQLRAEYAVK